MQNSFAKGTYFAVLIIMSIPCIPHHYTRFECECRRCELEVFPFRPKIFPCTCKVCLKEVDPDVLNSFFNNEKVQKKYLEERKDIYGVKQRDSFDVYGVEAVATHYLQDALDEFKKSGKTIPFLREYFGTAKVIKEFREKYHRLPPCFKERMKTV
jgi:hypothetical protein